MPDPSDTIVRICENKKITIYGDSIDSDAISFHWDFGNNQFSNLRNPTISYSTNGVFNVKVIINRLSGTIDTLTQPILISSLQEEISIGGNSQSGNYQTIQTSLIKITPNPNSGYFKLEVNFKSPFVLEIYDVLGRKIWNSQNNLTSGSFDINISSQINGIYYLKAISNDGIVTIKKIIKI
ncbi:MAG: T9SS type A sorting domain-containing protein [Bacteroidia bacterium]